MFQAALNAAGSAPLYDLNVLTYHGAVGTNASPRPVTLDLSQVLPGGFTAVQLTAPSVSTLITGPSSTSTATTSGTGRLRVGPYTLAPVTPG